MQPISVESRYMCKPTRQDIVDRELKKQAEELAEVHVMWLCEVYYSFLYLKKSQFKANPMPDFSVPLEVKLPKRIKSERRREKYQEEFREKVISDIKQYFCI